MLTRLQLGAHHLLQTRLQALGVLSKEKSKFCGAQGQVKNSTQTERSQNVPNVGVSTLRSRRRRAHWNTHTHTNSREHLEYTETRSHLVQPDLLLFC